MRPLRITAAALLLAFPDAVHAQVLRNAFWQPDGPVNATAYANGTLYVGGNFTHVSPWTGAAAELDAGTAKLIAPLRVLGKVDAITGDGAGGWFLGGAFTSVEGVARQNLAHVDAKGNLTAWNPGANGEVFALAFDFLHPNALYVSGSFTTLGGQTRNELGAVDPATGAVRAWQPAVTADQGAPEIRAMAVRAGYIYFGGHFSKVNGLYRFNVAIVDTFDTDQPFDPDVNGTVRALAVRALVQAPFTVTVYLGGDFTFINGQAANHLGSVDGNSGVTNSFAATLDGPVDALALSIGNFNAVTVWAGGAFNFANATQRSHLASFNGSGALNAWNPGANDEVDALVYANGVLWAGGKFHGAGGRTRSHFAAITTGGVATDWDPAPDSTVRAIGISGSTVIAGGEFSSIGGVARRNLAALNGVTGEPTSWDPSPNRPVTGLLADGSTLYVGGYFDSLGAQQRTGLAQLALPSSTPTSWNPRASGPVTHFLVHKSLVYVAGFFTQLGQTTRPGLGAIDAQGNIAAWNPGYLNGSVYALAANSKTIFVGGQFAGIANDANRRSAAGLDDVTAAVTPWNPTQGEAARVDALVLNGGTMWIGGQFQFMGGAATYALARVDTIGGYTNGPQTTADPAAEVKALRLDGGTLYLGGILTALGGASAGNPAAINATSGTVLAWNPNLVCDVQTLASGAGSVYATGLFRGTASPYTPMPPTHLAAITTTVTGVEDGPRDLLTLRVTPNPARSDMLVRFALPSPCRVEACVFDVSGRRVRTLEASSLAAGEQSLPWDGRDDRGRRVPPGLYLVEVRAGATEVAAKALRSN